MTTTTKLSLAEGVDRCVSCGLCVPQCPTWQDSHNEVNSPRGRIMLMAQLTQGKHPTATEFWLDACLGCGRCQEVCPSEVPYLDMLAQAKQLAPPQHPFALKALRQLVMQPHAGRVLGFILTIGRIGRLFGLHQFLKHHLQVLVRTIPPAPRKLSLPSTTPNQEAVGLFVGCVGEQLDNPALVAATRLLSAVGYEVCRPPAQRCCGAIARHAGDLATIATCAEHNMQAFANCAHIATTASGCSAELTDQLTREVVDAGTLIAARAAQLNFAQAPGTQVVLHTPCSQARCAGAGAWIKELLGHIPQLELIDAPASAYCCGAGGLTHLTHPEAGTRLALGHLEAISAQLREGVTLLTTNHACGWHLATAAAEIGVTLKVAHPLTFASRYLRS